MALSKRVFATELWKQEIHKKFVPVSIEAYYVDIASDQKQNKEQEKYNQSLMVKFHINYFTSIFLLDPRGRPYAKTGFIRADAKKFLTHLQKLQKRKHKRDVFWDKAKKVSGTKRLSFLLDVIHVLDEKQKLSVFYPSLQQEIFSNTYQNNKLKLQYIKKLALYYQNLNPIPHTKKNFFQTKFKNYLKLLEKEKSK